MNTSFTRSARILLVVLLALLAACGGSEERLAAHMERGKAFVAERNYEKARLEFKNALQIDEGYVDARFELAQVLENLQQWRQAVAHYLRIIEDNPEHVGAKVRVGKLYLLARAFDEVQKQIDDTLALDPNNADALALRASMKVQQEDFEGAIADLNAALKSQPHHVESLALLASLEMKGGQVEKAVKLLERGAENNPQHVGIKVILAGTLTERGQLEDAARLYKEIVDAEPEKLSHYIRLANFFTRTQQVDKAEATMRQAVERLPDDPKAKLALTEFLSQQRGTEIAEAELVNLIRVHPDIYELRFGLAKLYDESGKSEQAKQILEQIVNAENQARHGLTARTKLALMMLREGNVDRAAELVEEVLLENSNDQEALMVRAEVSMARGDALAAIGDIRTALRDEPNSPTLLKLLSKAHLANKEPELAIDAMRKAVEENPNDLELRFTYVRVLGSIGNNEEAMAQLDKLLEQAPNNPQALESMFRAQTASEDWKGALETADRIKKAFPDRPQGYYLAGLVYQAQKRFDESISEFNQALEQSPDAAEPLTQLIKSYLAVQSTSEAVKRLDEVIAAKPENFLALNLKGEVLLIDKQYEPAIVAFRKAIAVNPAWITPYRSLSKLYVERKDLDSAIEVLQEGKQATKRSPLIGFDLATLLERRGDHDAAINEYESLLNDRPEFALAMNNLAMLLVDKKADQPGSLDRALSLAEQLKANENPAFLDTIGWVHYRRGEAEQAIPYLEKAVAGAPDQPVLHYHLGMAYYQQGATDSARENLQKAVDGKVSYQGIDDANATLKKLAGDG